MPKPSEAYPYQLVLINEFPIDCTLSETHSFDSDVTEFPIESGSVITDNVRLQPMTIDLDCIVSNNPFGEIASNVITQSFSPDPDLPTQSLNALRSSVAYQRMIDIRDKREPITIRTSRGTFTNMVLKTLGIPRDDKTGDAIRFTAHFIHVVIVENARGKRVAIPIAKTGGTSTKPPAKSDKGDKRDDGRVYEGTRMMTTISDRGIENVWHDPDINMWRHLWYQVTAPDVVNEERVNIKSNFVYVKGKLLDGFMGSDAECIAHHDKLFQQFGNSTAGTAAYTNLLLRGHNPYKSYPATPSPTYSNATLGRVMDVNGKPGMPARPRTGDLHSRIGKLQEP